MWGRETFAMAVSSSSMNVASVTVMAISQGLMAFVWSILVESARVPAAIFTSCRTQMADETARSQIMKRSIGVLTAPKGVENASWLETGLVGISYCSDSVRAIRELTVWFRFRDENTVSGIRALIADRGSNPLSASIAGEDELNDDNFGRLAGTHLAHLRNGSAIRRSSFVLSATHAPPRSPGSFLHIDQMTAETVRSHQGKQLGGAAFLGSGQQSRSGQLITIRRWCYTHRIYLPADFSSRRTTQVDAA